MKTDDTIVIGVKAGNITFFKSYDFVNDKEEAMKDLSHVQSKEFDAWYISSLETWMLVRPPNIQSNEEFRFNIKTP